MKIYNILNKRVLYWLPRVLALVFICFLGIFAIDVFSMEGSFLEKIVGFFIHLIPNYVLIGLTVFAWKNEKIGGLGFILLAIIFTFIFKTYNELFSFLSLSIPIFITGVLFLFHSFVTTRELPRKGV